MDHEVRGEWYLAKQIAVGILVAAAVIFVGFHIYLALVVKAAEKVGQQAVAEMQQQSSGIQAQLQKQQAEQRRRADQARLDKTYADAARMRAEAAAVRADQEASARKAVAWERYYKPSKRCLNPPDWDTQVECGNAHIRAQKKFEAGWASGEIQ